MPFSVLMSIYAKEKPDYFEVCLRSLVSQTVKADEVVLVQDGPIPLELLCLIERFRVDLNIVSVPLVENVGLAFALNEGLKRCSHELVARMDTDDFSLPDRFEKQVLFMMSNSDIVASSGFIEEFDDEGHILSQRTLPLEYGKLVEFAKWRSPLSHPAVIFRKEAILRVGGYPALYPEDYLLWVKVLQAGYKIGNLRDVLVRMRTGSDFMGRRGWRFLRGELVIYKYMHKTGFINSVEYVAIVVLKSIVRLSPGFFRSFLYRVAR